MAAVGRASWGELLGRIGRSAVELWRAELTALQGELGETGRVLTKAVALTAVAAFLAFWALGLLFTALVAALALVLPVWAAAAIVLSVVALAAYLVWLSARKRYRDLESPVSTVKRRVSDHVAWWQDQVMPPEEGGLSADAIEIGPDEAEEEVEADGER